jgi:hypothetical protein
MHRPHRDGRHHPDRGPLIAKIVLGIALMVTPYLAYAVDQPNPTSPPQSSSSTKSKKDKSASAQDFQRAYRVAYAALKEVIDGASTSTSTTY